MEVGRTDIINQALLYAHQDIILDPEGDSKNAKLCAQFYDMTLQEALSGHPWNFALLAAQLQSLVIKPRDIRFQYAYQLPENFGYMHSVLSAELISPIPGTTAAGDLMHFTGDRANSIPIPEYIIQGQEMYSNYQDIQILYSRTDVKAYEMPAQFRNYFAASLALKLYLKITGGTDGYEVLNKRTVILRAEARHIDSSQSDTITPNRPNLFVRAREY